MTNVRSVVYSPSLASPSLPSPQLPMSHHQTFSSPSLWTKRFSHHVVVRPTPQSMDWSCGSRRTTGVGRTSLMVCMSAWVLPCTTARHFLRFVLYTLTWVHSAVVLALIPKPSLSAYNFCLWPLPQEFKGHTQKLYAEREGLGTRLQWYTTSAIWLTVCV